MLKENNDAMVMAGIIFGIFCLVVVIGGIVYVMSVSSQPAYADTFGTTLSPTANTSQNLVNATALTGTQVIVPIIMIGGVIAVCAMVFLIYAASKMRG